MLGCEVWSLLLEIITMYMAHPLLQNVIPTSNGIVAFLAMLFAVLGSMSRSY